ncbi:MAG: hypothetical protein LT071_13910 [Nocardioides sp.]|nr:hypothetical protein [Nocardioides sp.]
MWPSRTAPKNGDAPGGALPPAWAGLIDDAAIFPPGNADLRDAIDAWHRRQDEWHARLAGTLVVRDTDLTADLTGIPLSVVCTTGAGAVEGVVAQSERKGLTLAGLEIALRGTDDLEANARRVEYAVRAVQDQGLLDDDVPVYLELPQGDPTHGWLAAADVVEESGFLRLKFRTGGIDAHLFPTPAQLGAWIEAADERDLTWKCTAGLHHAVRQRDPGTGFEHHGFLNVLAAAVRSRAGEGADAVVAALETTDLGELRPLLGADEVERIRGRRFISFGSCSVAEPLDDLLALNLLEAPR